jgi:hypothetical protein
MLSGFVPQIMTVTTVVAQTYQLEEGAHFLMHVLQTTGTKSRLLVAMINGTVVSTAPIMTNGMTGPMAVGLSAQIPPSVQLEPFL